MHVHPSAPLLDPREADARLYLEALPHDPEGRGCIWIALNGVGEWRELGPFRAGLGELRDAASGQVHDIPEHALDTPEQVLDTLARFAVHAADLGHDIYACPYPHRRGGRRGGGAVARKVAHADIDGPVDVERVREIGAFAVASGSVSAGGQHGHVYVHLTRSLDPEPHAVLCRALGHYVGGEYADEGKHTDNDVLRIPGTINHKRGERRPVGWLVRPDEAGVRTWEPEELAAALGVELEPSAAVREPSEELAREPGPVSNLSARLEALAREVREAPRGEGNSHLNWAAGVAAALNREGGAEDREAHESARAALVEAFASRPVPGGESAAQRRAEAERTVRSGWEWGWQNPAEALRDRGAEVTGSAAAPLEAEDDGGGSTWSALDVASVARGLQSGTLKTERPTVGQLGLSDGEARALLYAGRVNGIAGKPGSGKTWTALAVSAQLMAEGAAVVFIDLEDTIVGVVSRLLFLGADPEALGHLFHYVNPEEPLGTTGWAALSALLDEVCPALVVIDSTGESIGQQGYNPNSDDEVATWFRRVPKPIARHTSKPAVLVLDHVTKAVEGQDSPIGSQRKLAAIDGAQYIQREARSFSRERAGEAILRVIKDRHGAYARGQEVARLVVTPSGAGDGRLSAELVWAGRGPEEGEGFRPTALMERVSRYLEATPGPADRTQNKVKLGVKGKATSIVTALAVLVEEGYATTATGERNSTVYSVAKPYRESGEQVA